MMGLLLLAAILAGDPTAQQSVRLCDPNNRNVCATVIPYPDGGAGLSVAGIAGTSTGGGGGAVTGPDGGPVLVNPAAQNACASGEVLCNPYPDGGAALIPFIAGQRYAAAYNLAPGVTWIGYTPALTSWGGNGGIPMAASPDGQNAGGSHLWDVGAAITAYCSSSVVQVDGGGLRWEECQ